MTLEPMHPAHRAMDALRIAGLWPHDGHVKRDLTNPAVLWAEPYGVARHFGPCATERDIGDWLAGVAEDARTDAINVLVDAASGEAAR